MRGRRDDNSDGKSQRIEVKPGQVLEVNVDDTGVAVVLHLASPGGVVEFGYGVVAMVDDPAAAQLALPRTVSEGPRVPGPAREAIDPRGADRQQPPDHVPARRARAGVCRGAARRPAGSQVLAELQHGAADWPLSCEWVTIATAPDPQHVTITVQSAPAPKPR